MPHLDCRAVTILIVALQEGDVAAKPQGGDRRSGETEVHAALILRLYEADPEIFLPELCAGLAEHGVQISTSALSRFFARHAITRKKRRLYR